MRYVIQSADTGQFLAPSFEDGQPEWVTSLKHACIVEEFENCVQLIEDHTDFHERPQIIDLDNLYSGEK